eukprot:12516158-Alexandrium_andersonii.AAC.1
MGECNKGDNCKGARLGTFAQDATKAAEKVRRSTSQGGEAVTAGRRAPCACVSGGRGAAVPCVCHPGFRAYQRRTGLI